MRKRIIRHFIDRGIADMKRHTVRKVVNFKEVLAGQSAAKELQKSVASRVDDPQSEWLRKGGTLTDKTACKEFGLTADELAQAFKAGKLQARYTSIFGNPCIRLLRREVEALVKNKRGANYLNEQQAKNDLAQVNRDLKQLKKQAANLEKRRSDLMARLEK